MIGVLVKNGATVIAKDVYSGDDAKSQELVVAFMNKNKDLTVEIHKDTDPDWKTAFEAVSAVPVVSKEKTDWQTEKAKGTSAAIDYIAKKLGLE